MGPDPGPKRGISTGHAQPVTALVALVGVSQTGFPVVWLATGTETQRRTLEVQGRLPTQVRMMLLRAGVPREDLSGIRVMVDSEQGRTALLDRG
jgi:hypothetical protein